MKKILLTLLITTSLSAQTIIENQNPTLDRLNRIENDLFLLQQKIYTSTENPTISNHTYSDKGLENLFIRIDEIEQSVQNLTSKFEQITFQQDQIEKKVNTLQADIDLRFKDFEQKKTPAEPIQILPPQPTVPPTIEEKTPQAQYDKAFNLLKDGAYGQAQTELRQFLSDYPNDNLAGNAQYWLGETYYTTGDYENALIHFATGFKKYKTNPKAADCLLKLGMSMVRIGKLKEACTAFKNLPLEFPNTSETLKERALAEAEKIKCN